MKLRFPNSGDQNLFQAELEAIRQRRRNRFRILVCIDGSDASYEGLKFAGKIGQSEDCDIVLLYVREIDQGLRSGGLQVRVARENMLDWGLELPGIRYLKRGLELLTQNEGLSDDWTAYTGHTDTWGDPLGDNKVEYRHENGKSIVLKLKTAPDVASGILDQYELGPYNLIILGAPTRWRGEIGFYFHAGVAQKVAVMAPCSVMIARTIDGEQIHRKGRGHLICTDGTEHSLDSMRRDAVLAHFGGYPITLLCVARYQDDIATAARVLEQSSEILRKLEIPVEGTRIVVGDPTEEIVRVGKDFAVIVISDSRKKWIQRFFISGGALKVMGVAPTSVLNVR